MDSPSDSGPSKHSDRVVRRLASIGVPVEYLGRLYEGIVDFAVNNQEWMPKIVSAILPKDEEVAEYIRETRARSKKPSAGPTMKGRFRESMVWLQWLMFEGDPTNVLMDLANMSIDQRGVCGAVWGVNDIAYRCRTCENDPTCAICVPCFQNGDHKDHDYSIIYTGGGCCDCGDETAWKRKGFCSKHKGSEQILPLPENLAKSVGPVLDSLLICWKQKLSFAESIFQEKPRASDLVIEHRKAANELTFAVVEMLLTFCTNSESLLSFVSKRVICLADLLDILIRAERFLSEAVVKKLHELLLKLLGEPIFKYEFAKVFLSYYPLVIHDAIKEFSDNILKKYPLLSTFSVQIFTVPTLTPRLVKEMDLLSMLLGCLGHIFHSCAGEDGHLQAARWGSLYETTNRVVGDIKFVVGHDVVSKYVTHYQRDILRIWMNLLASVQGMNPMKRETGIHIEEENESMQLLFILGHSIANIHFLLVDGAFSPDNFEEMGTNSNMHKQDIDDNLRHAKVGRLSEDSSICSVAGRTSLSATVNDIHSEAVPSSVLWLTYECLRAMENWLVADQGVYVALDDVFPPNNSKMAGKNFLKLKKTLSKFRRGRNIFGGLSIDDHGAQSSLPVYSGYRVVGDSETAEGIGLDSRMAVASVIDSDAYNSVGMDGKSMDGDDSMELDSLRVLCLSQWLNIAYDVSSQEVSVHIPLHRLLSLILQKALGRCFVESPNVAIVSSAGPSEICTDFFGQILGGYHPFGFSAFVMEHPLRIRVFCAQVNAGMWRKNGDIAPVSCEWYRSVRWSEQGLELDLFILQCCAALAPPDLFVCRILDRFGLSNYISLSLDQSSEYESVLVKEMLTLIIQVIQERRFSGLNTADNLKRELIYKLAVGDATHSQLVKSLPRDLSKVDQLQEILNRVASYSNPSGFNQGMYSLRWAYWKELDLYHPRWNSRDMQVAEERYLRFCGGSALITQLPRWTKIYPPLEGVARIATCRMIHQIIRAVIFYAVFTDKTNESRASEGILITALHLLSLALDICSQQKGSCGLEHNSGDSVPMLVFSVEEIIETQHFGAGKQCMLSLLVALMRMHRKENIDSYMEAGNYSISPLIEGLLKKFAEIDSQCMTKLQQLAPELVSHFSPSFPTSSLDVPGPASDSEKRKAKARERQAAILEKMKAEQSKFLSSISSTTDNDSGSGVEGCEGDVVLGSEDAVQDVCSLCRDPASRDPVSFLILLQKSRLLGFVDQGTPLWDHNSDKECVPIPMERIDRSGASTSSSGSGLISSQLVQLTEAAFNEFVNNGQGERRDINAILEFVKSRIPSMRRTQAASRSDDGGENAVYIFETLEEDLYELIQKEMINSMLNSCDVKDGGFPDAGSNQDIDANLLGKYIAAVSKEASDHSSASENAHIDRLLKECTSKSTAYDGFGPADCDGIYVSSCGHAVHQRCLERYLSSLKERYVRRNIFEGAHIVDPDQGEFLCPVCRRLANSVLPAVHENSQKDDKPMILDCGTDPAARASQLVDEKVYCLQLQQALLLLRSAAKVVARPDILEALPFHRKEKTSGNLEPISRMLRKMYFPKKQDRFLGSPRVSHSIILWDTLKYTLMSIEIAARCGKTSPVPNYTLVSLYKELKTSSGFILSLLLKVVQNLRSTNSLHMLQRFRGLQLLMESVCSGVSVDYYCSNQQGGNLLGLLKLEDDGISYPDIQFWNRASDPVLARDPFSTLMWVLFCFPCPFLSCKESLIPLVHIFYAVTAVQALITCCGAPYKTPDLGFQDCLITDACKFLGESKCAQQYFVSNYIDCSCDIKDMVRRLCFPYLRRCALLWRLLDSSAPAPCSDRDNEDVSTSVINDMMDASEDSLMELNEVGELEKMFSIPSLDVLIKDNVVRSLASKWFHHFAKDYEACNGESVYHCNPAVPFKLMNLPHLYQDLLQRYIKQCCPHCKTALDDPALCLLCGRLCSPSWKPCCRESGCLAHAMACGAGIGVFLLIRRTTILLQRCARQAPWPSPYLDAYGEEDIEMHRGKPLYLNEERYAALAYMVASHGLDRSSRVLGQTTIGNFFVV